MNYRYCEIHSAFEGCVSKNLFCKRLTTTLFLFMTWIRDGFWGRRVEIACISCANNVSMAAMLANPMG